MICLHKNLYTNVQRSIIIIPNSQEVGKIQMPINWWMNKQNVNISINRIVFSHKKEWSIDLCYNTDEPQKYAKWNKAHHKRLHTVCSHLHEIPRIGKSTETENRLVARCSGEREWGVTASGYGVAFGAIKTFWNLNILNSEYTKTTVNCTI